MKKIICAILMGIIPLTTVSATTPNGKIEKPFVINNKIVCLEDIQKQITPYLRSFEEESGVKYKYNVHLIYRTRIL